jgi:hypothetical protein
MGQHVKSKRGFGDYEVTIGGTASTAEDGSTVVEDGDVFTYDVNKDESGSDVIVNFESLRDSEAKKATKK